MNNIRTMLTALKENDGFTIKKAKPIKYKTGYQVADYGVECYTIEEAEKAIKDYNGTCGVWYSEKIYYVDHSFRVKTKKEALKIGKEYNQISVLKWSDMSLVYC